MFSIIFITVVNLRQAVKIKGMICSILRGVKAAIQLEMNSIFEEADETSVSKLAFSKRRQDIETEYIRSYADQVSEFHAKDEDRLMYKGMTVVAIDGNDIALPSSKSLLEYYGGSGSKKSTPTALASLAYDPLNSCVYDFRLDKFATDERTLAKAHMTRLKELGLCEALLLFDRWYPSKEVMAYILSQGFSFSMRVRNRWTQDVDNVKRRLGLTLPIEIRPTDFVYSKANCPQEKWRPC